MNELQKFNFEGNGVRTVNRDGEIWFVAKDVCEVLGISKYRDALLKLDPDERVSIEMDTPGGAQKMSAINESGLYKISFKSRKLAAKRFTKWVTGEVLPSIRKTGGYGQIESRALIALADAMEKIAATTENLVGRIERLEAQNAYRGSGLAAPQCQETPEEDFIDWVLANPLTYRIMRCKQRGLRVKDICAELGICRNTVWEYSRKAGPMMAFMFHDSDIIGR